MKKSILFLTLVAMMAAGCNLSGYKRTKTGLYYKVISDSKSQPLKAGQYVKMHIQAFIHDSLFFDTREKMPQFGMVDTAGGRYDFTEILPMMGNKDSAVTIQLVDSLMKLPGVQLPPFFRKGDKIKTCFRIIKSYDSVAVAQADYTAEVSIYKEKQDAKNAVEFEKAKKVLDDYLAKNKVNAAATPKGAFVEVKQAGTGAVADSGKVVGVKYRGTLLDGTEFDSNMSPGRTDTMRFVVAGGRMIAGFDDGVRGQKVGSKLKIYIPAKLGYGAEGSGAILPYSNLIFDVEIVEVTERKNPAPPTAAGN